jgi:ABC-type nickel/cobalt efflux system permease component RcnA
MIGKVALGGICAGLTLFFAMRAHSEAVRTTATVAGSCLLGFTVTTLVLERNRERKNRQTNADVYIEFLRQMNHQQAQTRHRRPAVCQGCSHYHGRVYGGNLLVCGMHPYGAEGEYCDDWQDHDIDIASNSNSHE